MQTDNIRFASFNFMLPKRLWALLIWITCFSLHSRAAIADSAFRSGALVTVFKRLVGCGKEVVQSLVTRHVRGNSSSLRIRGRTKKILLNVAFVLPQLFEAVGHSEDTAAPLHLTFALTIYSFVNTLKRKESLIAEQLVLGAHASHESSLSIDSIFRPFFFIWHHRDNLLQCRKQLAVKWLLGTLVLTVIPKSSRAATPERRRRRTLRRGHPVGNSGVVHSVLHFWSLQESIMGVSRERRALKREIVSLCGCWCVCVWWIIHVLCHLRTKREVAWVYNNYIILLLHFVTNLKGRWSHVVLHLLLIITFPTCGFHPAIYYHSSFCGATCTISALLASCPCIDTFRHEGSHWSLRLPCVLAVSSGDLLSESLLGDLLSFPSAILYGFSPVTWRSKELLLFFNDFSSSTVTLHVPGVLLFLGCGRSFDFFFWGLQYVH